MMGGLSLNILSLLDVLEDELERGTNLPIGNRALVNKGKCLEIIRDIRLNMPEEIKQAEWIKMERQNSGRSAERIRSDYKDAEAQIESLIEENEITQGLSAGTRDHGKLPEQC